MKEGVGVEGRSRRREGDDGEGEDGERKNEKFYGVLQLIGVSTHMQILDVSTQGAWRTILKAVHTKTRLHLKVHTSQN